MYHRDRIGSPSIERLELVEKRMEMIALLINRMNKGEMAEEKNKASGKRKSRSRSSVTFNWIGRFVLMMQRMFL